MKRTCEQAQSERAIALLDGQASALNCAAHRTFSLTAQSLAWQTDSATARAAAVPRASMETQGSAKQRGHTQQY